MIRLHATCVSMCDQGVLILGASGSGKSALALTLLSLGANLVSDDATEISQQDGKLCARCPKEIEGMIEARGVGLLRAESLPMVELDLIIDLDQTESDRLPLLHTKKIHGVQLPCLYKIDASHFPAAIIQYLKAGRKEPS